MKKTKIILAGMIVLLIIACTVHVVTAYINILNDVSTSAPATIAFLLIIPYALAVAVCTAVLIVIYIKSRK